MYPKIVLTALAAVFAFSSFANTTAEILRQNYIEQHKELAICQMYEYEIPASITLAQGIFESGNGQGKLAVRANNHFGIKCKAGWQGETYAHEDDDYDKNGDLIKSCFRAYPSVDSSYRDHSLFLRGKERYDTLVNYGLDYEKWAHGLKRAGYATDPSYAEKLIKLIEKYELQKYDQPRPKVELHVIVPPVSRKNNYATFVSEDSSEAPANPAIESTTTDYLRKPKVNMFVLAEPVTRETVENPNLRHELIPSVSKSDASDLAAQRILSENPVRPIGQAIRLRTFARR